jgi:hypothetical protein
MHQGAADKADVDVDATLAALSKYDMTVSTGKRPIVGVATKTLFDDGMAALEEIPGTGEVLDSLAVLLGVLFD